jgi:hypothetical protein
MQGRESGGIFARNSRERPALAACLKLCLGKMSDRKLAHANRQSRYVLSNPSARLNRWVFALRARCKPDTSQWRASVGLCTHAAKDTGGASDGTVEPGRINPKKPEINRRSTAYEVTGFPGAAINTAGFLITICAGHRLASFANRRRSLWPSAKRLGPLPISHLYQSSLTIFGPRPIAAP